MAEGRHAGDPHFTDNTYPGYGDGSDYAGPDGIGVHDDTHTGTTYESYVARRPTPAHRADSREDRPGRDETVHGSTGTGEHISERHTGAEGSSIGELNDGEVTNG